MIENEPLAAYITFKFSATAHLAYVDNDATKKVWSKFVVEPAPTWLQPFTQLTKINQLPAVDIDSNQPSLEVLNDDCLEKLFEFCDLNTIMCLLEVNKRFNGLIHQYGFRHITSFEIDFSKKTLLNVRKALKCIGRHINKLKINVCDGWEIDLLKRLRIENLIGNNLRELTVCYGWEHTLNLIDWQSSLHGLKSLEILTYKMNRIDLQEVCPNLNRLVLHDLEEFMIPTTTWPTLKSFALNIHLEGQTLNEFNSFLENNPQLECVEFSAWLFDWQTITNQLLNLSIKAMCINALFIHQALDFSFLTSMRQLSSLKIVISEFDDFNDVLNLLNLVTQATELRELELEIHGCAYFSHEELDLLNNEICNMQRMMRLEKLILYAIVMKATTVVEIVRHAKHLMVLSIQNCEGLYTDISQTFVDELLEARKLHQNQNSALELAVDEEVNNLLKELRKINGKEIERNLNIHSVPIPSRFYF